MTYALIVPPVAEPLTLAEVKAHLRLDATDEDALLASLQKTAREHLERMSGLALMRQTLRLYLDDWPEGPVRIGRGPVQSIEAVRIYDGAGVPRALSLAGHVLDGASLPARLWLSQREESARAVNGIEIDFIAGYASANEVPGDLKRAMLTHVALMFSFRGAVLPENQPAGVPDGYDRLVAPYLARRL